jgi:hypothetical protein
MVIFTRLGRGSLRHRAAGAAFLVVALLLAASPAAVVGATRADGVAGYGEAAPVTPPTGASLRPGATFHPLGPTRIIDTRIGLGATGALRSDTPTAFQIGGSFGVPADATAITGTLTIASPTRGGYVAISPVANGPTMISTSNVNFAPADELATSVTTPLGPGGLVWALYRSGHSGDTVSVIFDISGFFSVDAGGATYHNLGATRAIDTRTGTAGPTPLRSDTPVSFQIGGQFGVPEDAVAITGTLTISGPSGRGYVAITPVQATPATIGTSTVNFVSRKPRSAGLTVPLGPDGRIWALYRTGRSGDAAHAVLDISGYFSADPTGAVFHAIGPVRVVDTRVGTGSSGALKEGATRAFPVGGAFGIPTEAVAITGTLTVAYPTRGGYLAVDPAAPEPAAVPASGFSFNATVPQAMGLTMPLGAGSQILTFYQSGRRSDTVHVILDVSGYFRVDPPEMQPLPAYFRSWLPDSAWILDANGVVLKNYGTASAPNLKYTPTQISQAAICYWNLWQSPSATEEQKLAARDGFFKQISWLVANQNSNGLWYFTFKWGTQPVPWWSAMAQGISISALLRAYSVTGDAAYLPVIERARAVFERDTAHSGVFMNLTVAGKTIEVYEEYLTGGEPHVLNGWGFATVGLYEAAVYLEDPTAFVDVFAADRGLAAMRVLLPYYDTGSWTYYSLWSLSGSSRGPLASSTYHKIHTGEMYYFGSETRNAVLIRYGDIFQSYLDRRLEPLSPRPPLEPLDP